MLIQYLLNQSSSQIFKLKIGNLEKIEGIELLRAIENKITVGTYDAKTNSFSINTQKILDKLKNFI